MVDVDSYLVLSSKLSSMLFNEPNVFLIHLSLFSLYGLIFSRITGFLSSSFALLYIFFLRDETTIKEPSKPRHIQLNLYMKCQ